ncbi:Serine/Threonine-kinase pakA-like protein [Thalictrum thalictroides]|uniref:Serine/Threonine-kinase pakA-like protein n=1 Tax=Thalictrum thalictroides TaxID=46969 RepID=A0A7J6WLJ8_THATH|nr:Serine/Threonine-kinase pakA-like protein [Thalictrum thalictroides]
MDFERSHRNGTSSSSELFICFTSRPSFSSSSSMKISSKPILSPNRCNDHSREPSLAFSSSLNRRLGSMKGGGGGQSSPMFKKRGVSIGFENAEPTSPKVTCIGQVRVKTKKQGKKMMNLRKREGTQGGILEEKKGEECLTHRSQKWVHLPLTICEALRGFGAEFNCFQPCGGRSCSSRSRGEKRRTMSSCGAVFAKWLMALQEGEEEKRREIRVIVGEEEKREEVEGFEGIEIEIDEEKKRRVEEKIGEYEEERYSICIPPRNALLLMRCRSDPLKMSALANRFWDSPIQDEDEEDGDSEDEENEESERDDKLEEEVELEEEDEVVEEQECLVEEENPLKEQCVSTEIDEEEQEVSIGEENPLKEQLVFAEIEEEQENPLMEQWGLAELFEEHVDSVEEETGLKKQWDSTEVVEQQDKLEEETSEEEQCGSAEILVEDHVSSTEEEISIKKQCGSAEIIVEDLVSSTEEEISIKKQCGSAEILVEDHASSTEEELKEEATIITVSTFESVEVIETIEGEEKEVKDKIEEEKEIKQTALEKGNEEHIDNQNCSALDTERVEQSNNIEEEKRSKERENTVLPDCLLMMLCEPKLSMEVSKETWVCSTDFTPRRSQKKVIDGGDNEIMNKGSENLNPAQQQTQQLSCVSYPVPSMSSMIEQKLMNAVAYEPFVLTRCKSEPLRNSAKLVPEACFWNNQQLEPRPGVGF